MPPAVCTSLTCANYIFTKTEVWGATEGYVPDYFLGAELGADHLQSCCHLHTPVLVQNKQMLTTELKRNYNRR